jgi:hypothetical protein
MLGEAGDPSGAEWPVCRQWPVRAARNHRATLLSARSGGLGSFVSASPVSGIKLGLDREDTGVVHRDKSGAS